MPIIKTSKTKKIKPPFGYFGSKNKIALQICKNLPPHNCWVEAFCGSSAVTLSKSPAPIEVINDLDDEIVNLFKQLRKNHGELTRAISLTPYARQELTNARKKTKKINNLERARRFLVSAMMAVNGIFGEQKGGFSYSLSYARNFRDARVNRWYNLPERLKDVVERLRSIRIEKRNALNLLKDYLDKPATLIYFDPPYFAERTNGYNKEANNEKFHKSLLELANKAKCMIFISSYDNKLYRTMLTTKKGWSSKKIQTITKDVSGKSHKRTEVVWMNKHFKKAQKLNRVPIRLSSEEKKMNKINPSR
jgi:DNA adenine methylase